MSTTRLALLTPSQKQINAQLGLSDEVFLTYAEKSEHPTDEAAFAAMQARLGLDPLQKQINAQLGVSDDVFLKYNQR